VNWNGWVGLPESRFFVVFPDKSQLNPTLRRKDPFFSVAPRPYIEIVVILGYRYSHGRSEQ